MVSDVPIHARTCAVSSKSIARMVVYATLHALYKNGSLSLDELVKARKKLGLDHDKPNPMTV